MEGHHFSASYCLGEDTRRGIKRGYPYIRALKNSSNVRYQFIPQVEFDKLQTLTKEEIEAIKRKGAVLVKNVVDDAQAAQWREDLKKFVKANPVEGEQAFVTF